MMTGPVNPEIELPADPEALRRDKCIEKLMTGYLKHLEIAGIPKDDSYLAATREVVGEAYDTGIQDGRIAEFESPSEWEE